MSGTRRRAGLTLATGLVLLAGCSDDGQERSVPQPATTLSAGADFEPEPIAPSTTVASRELAVGAEARTPLGNTVVVYSYEQPVRPGRFTSEPDPGMEYAVLDVAGCAGPELVEGGLNPFYFELVMPDNRRFTPAMANAKEPPLRSSPLAPGDCIRGWVTYEVPAGQRPKAVVFSSGTDTVIRWALA